jgi:hypothetical protein
MQKNSCFFLRKSSMRDSRVWIAMNKLQLRYLFYRSFQEQGARQYH